MRRLSSFRLLVALGLVALFIGATVASERAARSMAAAATQFLGSLSAEQRQQAAFAFDSGERTKWHFIPPDMFPRNGLAIKAMTEPQRRLALAMLRTGLSQRGYMAATQIMDLENVLRDLEGAMGAAAPSVGGKPIVRDPERYFFSVFGTPSPTGAWGWRVEGHHVSVHFTVVNGSFVAGAPTFFGVNPAEVRSGPKTGQRVLGPEEDAARALLLALDVPRRARAVIKAVAPADIVTMNQLTVGPLEPSGILAGELTSSQLDALMKLVEAHASQVTDDVAAERMSRLRKAGVEKIGFAWAGESERGKPHYYRIQGPTFLVEHDNTQNDANHVHSVWRDFDGDFGRDLLREHLTRVAH